MNFGFCFVTQGYIAGPAGYRASGVAVSARINQGAACTACTEGHYSTETGSITCSDCPSGSEGTDNYGIRDSTAACTNCQEGQYAPSGSVSCANCPSGYEGTDSLQPIARANLLGACTLCAEGSYQDQSGQADCIDCSAGEEGQDSVALHDNSDTCIECADGTYNTESGAPDCQKCAVGKAGTDNVLVRDNEAGSCSDCMHVLK